MFAFYRCTSLTSVNIPDGVTSIEKATFGGCSSLTLITIPDSVTIIGDNAFFNCTSLESVNIPKSVTSIGIRAFYGCSTNITDNNFDEPVVLERVSIGGDPVIKPFFGSGYKVKLPDLPGHIYRLLQGGGVTINSEIMACPTRRLSRERMLVRSSSMLIIHSATPFIDLSHGVGCVECVLPDGTSWEGDATDGEIKHGVDPDYKGNYKQRIMSVGGGAMKFVIRIYEHPQVQNEFQVLRCNIDPSVHDGLLMMNYKPKLFFLTDLCDTRLLSKHKKNSNPLTFRHPVVKNQVTMKCA